MTKEFNQKVVDQARQYLLAFPDVTEKILNKHLTFPAQNRPKTKSALFKTMLDHAVNRQGMGNTIGNTKRLARFLSNFDADAVLKKYQSWDYLFDTIKKSSYAPPGRMDRNNARSYWVIFCKSILSIARFVNRFETIDDFNRYIDQFNSDNPDIRLALPLILKEEIFGYQFALACDFVKENISPLFVKPDVHVKAIFIGIGLSQKGSSDYQIFRDLIEFSESINQVPYAVDKLFWLIGSGRFYWSDIQVPASRQKFIDQISRMRTHKRVR